MASRRPDPISDYIDWARNRYNPGHYLGGNAPPYLAKLSTPGLGKALLQNGILAAGVALSLAGWSTENWTLALTGVVLALISLGLRRRRRRAEAPSGGGPSH